MIISFSPLTIFIILHAYKTTEYSWERENVKEREKLFFVPIIKAEGKLNSHGEDEERSMQEMLKQQLQQKPTANCTGKTIQHQNHYKQLQ